jgi:hypothetical protein
MLLFISFADPGSDAFLTQDPGFGIGFFSDPGSRIPNPYFLELADNFVGKKLNNSSLQN